MGDGHMACEEGLSLHGHGLDMPECNLLASDQRFGRPLRGVETRNEVKHRVVIEQDEDRMFVAECTSLPGCISQGKTRAEALANVKDAIAGYLESVKKHGDRELHPRRRIVPRPSRPPEQGQPAAWCAGGATQPA